MKRRRFLKGLLGALPAAVLAPVLIDSPAGGQDPELRSGKVTVPGGDFAVDADVLFVDESTDRVGINTDTVSFSLDVNGTIRATDVVHGNCIVAGVI